MDPLRSKIEGPGLLSYHLKLSNGMITVNHVLRVRSLHRNLGPWKDAPTCPAFLDLVFDGNSHTLISEFPLKGKDTGMGMGLKGTGSRCLVDYWFLDVRRTCGNLK